MRGKKKKQKYKGQNVQLPENWVTVRRQYHLRGITVILRVEIMFLFSW